jgi:hypothetical protein
MVTKTVWYWCKDSYIGLWNKIETVEINFLIYGQLFLTRVLQQFNRKEQTF